MIELPPGFLFGASTAAFQIEGGASADGKGASIWDRFCHFPGKVAGGDTGDVACDHYHRFEEDLDLMAAAGLTAYRFSISWPRIFPTGTGAINEAGLAFYDRLVDGCLARGIAPWPCFYHWDLPQALQDRGGWSSRDSIDWYLGYVEAVVRRLDQRVSNWIMFNEPSIFTSLGYLLGVHAPGVVDPSAYGAAVHHVSLATAEGMRLVRRLTPEARVGTVFAVNGVEPATPSAADQVAALRADAIMNRSFLEPLFHGRYPREIDAMVAPFIAGGDLLRIREEPDFVGLNHYTRARISAASAVAGGNGATAGGGLGMASPSLGTSVTAMGWEIRPEGIYEALFRLRRDYTSAPIYVTENGGAFADAQGPDGTVDDQDRIALLQGYIGEIARACRDGVDVRGYMVWSLLDNFEWAHGYAKRFGIIHVDYQTLRRTPKASYHWYASLAKA